MGNLFRPMLLALLLLNVLAPLHLTAQERKATITGHAMDSNNDSLIGESIERTTAELQKIFGLSEPPDAATVKAIMTARPETPQATFDNITKTYGSFDNYLHDGLKLSDSDLASLREQLLEP